VYVCQVIVPVLESVWVFVSAERRLTTRQDYKKQKKNKLKDRFLFYRFSFASKARCLGTARKNLGYGIFNERQSIDEPQPRWVAAVFSNANDSGSIFLEETKMPTINLPLNGFLTTENIDFL
jgi:hypothetical protein